MLFAPYVPPLELIYRASCTREYVSGGIDPANCVYCVRGSVYVREKDCCYNIQAPALDAVACVGDAVGKANAI